jgi:hypothetical protein
VSIIVPLVSGAQREEFNFAFKSPVTHGGISGAVPTELPAPYDVTTEQILVVSANDHGGIIQRPLNFRGVDDE